MRRVLGLVAVAVALAGCSARTDEPVRAVAGAEQNASTGSAVPLPPTVPSTISPTSAVVVGTGPCPYLDTATVQDIVGQHLTRTTYRVIEPDLPASCMFSRANGEVAVDIVVRGYADPLAAQEAAQALGTSSANPVTDLGDFGVVLVAAGQTVLAVTESRVLISVTINQESSLEAHEIAALVLPQLP